MIEAHTVQKKLLRHLAEDGHVLAIGPDSIGQLRKHGAVPIPIGVGQASTFTGFCAAHDTKVFAPIESGEIALTPHHAFLLGYRAICLEVYKKETVNRMEATFLTLDRGTPVGYQKEFQRVIQPYLALTRLGRLDMENERQGYEALHHQGDWNDVHALFVRFQEPAVFMASTAVQPEADFRGRKLQDVEAGPDTPLHVVEFSFVESHGHALAVFTWLNGNASAEALIDSLVALPPDEIGPAVVRFAFEYTENLFISPSWWRALDDSRKAWVMRRYESSIVDERTASALMNDNVVVCRLTVLETRRF